MKSRWSSAIGWLSSQYQEIQHTSHTNGYLALSPHGHRPSVPPVQYLLWFCNRDVRHVNSFRLNLCNSWSPNIGHLYHSTNSTHTLWLTNLDLIQVKISTLYRSMLEKYWRNYHIVIIHIYINLLVSYLQTVYPNSMFPPCAWTNTI